MVVGTEGHTKTWHLPKELLVNSSPFFAAALNGSFAEATSKVVNLPEDNTDAFALFIRWLYIGEISGNLFRLGTQTSADEILGTYNSTYNSTSNGNPLRASTQVYLQAYNLGDKLGCLVFRDIAMLELIECHQIEVIQAQTMRIVFQKSTPGSKLREFAIDQFRSDLQHRLLREDAAAFVSVAKIAEDFGLDFLKACMEADGDAINPNEHRRRYIEVLTVTEED